MEGLGLYLQEKAQYIPERLDMVNPAVRVADLGPYEHLRRVFRGCDVHFFRNIRGCAVTEEVRSIMRSIACMEHVDLDGALLEITQKGGKAGKDWADNKVNAKFVLPAICWDLSSIPRAIWVAGPGPTNVSEILHRNINIEGVGCTLVGGVAKGLRMDTLQWSTLKVWVSNSVFTSLFNHFRSPTRMAFFPHSERAMFQTILSRISGVVVSSDKR